MPGVVAEPPKDPVEDVVVEDPASEFQVVGAVPDTRDDAAAIAAKVKQMSAPVLKEPPLYMLPFGQTWSQDVMAFHHNAMRRELQDMYYLVASMQRRALDLTHEDIDDFYEWFDLFEVFARDFFLLEEDVLFPWLATKVPKAELKTETEKRGDQKSSMLEALQEIDDCQSRFANLPAGEVLPILVRSLDTFAPSIVTYMADQEKELIPAVARYFTSAEKARYDNSLLAWVKGMPNSFFLWHLLIRPVSRSSGEHQALRKKFIASEGRFMGRYRMRRNYRDSQREAREAHFDIVRQFYTRWGKAAALEAEAEEAKAAEEEAEVGEGVPAGMLKLQEGAGGKEEDAEFVVEDLGEKEKVAGGIGEPLKEDEVVEEGEEEELEEEALEEEDAPMEVSEEVQAALEEAEAAVEEVTETTAAKPVPA